MKRCFLFSFIISVFMLFAQDDTLFLPFDATTLTDEQKNSNPDYLAYPLSLASQVPDINCNQSTDCMEAVDLGLSVKWATCNVGASSPEDYGDYFAWGETELKTTYDLSTYKHCKGTSRTMTKYCDNSSYGNNGFTDNKTVLDPADDAVIVNWGGSWRMPTYVEFNELMEQCAWIWTTQNGVNGYKVVGPNGNSIFLPAAGHMEDYGLETVGSNGTYWSSSFNTKFPDCNSRVYFVSNDVYWGLCSRGYGLSVRPVCK